METRADSPLGQVSVRVSTLEAEKEKTAARVARRKASLAEILDGLASLSLDATIDRAGALIIKRLAAVRLLEMAEEAEVEVARGLERAQGVKRELERRLWRLERELADLESETVVLNLSPSERKTHAVLTRWKLAVIAGDPKAVEDLRAAYESGEPVLHLGTAVNLDVYVRDIHQIADKAK